MTELSECAFQPVDDPLGEALHTLRMSGTFYSRSELREPWGIDLPAMPGNLLFHAVTSGSCWLELPDQEGRHLRAGDFALVPHGQGHILRSAPDAHAEPLFDIERNLQSERYEILRHGGDGPETTMICAVVKFDHPVAQHVIRMLPKIIVMDASSPENEWIHSAVRFMIAEAKSMRPGGDTIITRVSDILVIQAIRSWLDHDAGARTGWLGALQDRQIGHALTLVHRNPLQPWTVALLAEKVGMSRSAFASRFMALVEETPMHYVRRWRMQVAVSWLREGSMPVGELAEKLGYQSEAAFSRAFKKVIGIGPGAARRGALPRAA